MMLGLLGFPFTSEISALTDNALSPGFWSKLSLGYYLNSQPLKSISEVKQVWHRSAAKAKQELGGHLSGRARCPEKESARGRWEGSATLHGLEKEARVYGGEPLLFLLPQPLFPTEELPSFSSTPLRRQDLPSSLSGSINPLHLPWRQFSPPCKKALLLPLYFLSRMEQKRSWDTAFSYCRKGEPESQKESPREQFSCIFSYFRARSLCGIRAMWQWLSPHIPTSPIAAAAALQSRELGLAAGTSSSLPPPTDARQASCHPATLRRATVRLTPTWVWGEDSYFLELFMYISYKK